MDPTRRPEHKYRVDICLGCARQTYDDGTPCTCGESNALTIEVVSAADYRGAVAALASVQDILARVEAGTISDQDSWDGIEKAMALYHTGGQYEEGKQ